MFVDFRRAFNPTKEEQLKNIEVIKKAHDSISEMVDLIEVRDSNILMKSEPFQVFLHDCSYCDNYVDSNCGYIEGGHCKKHHISCGWGFTCKDWEQNVDFDKWYEEELKRIERSDT